MSLTIQLFHNSQWHDAALLEFPDPQQGRNGLTLLGYETPDYALQYLGCDDHQACSLTLPVDLMQTYRAQPWFGFLDDIMPSGASRRYWVDHLAIGNLPASQQDYQLLRQGTIAPVGNMRIKEAVPEKRPGSQLEQMRFKLADVIERDADFMQYAQQRGAAAGGATGAGGEAPKLLLRCSATNNIWIDTFQDDLSNTDISYLVKFPRGQRTRDDCDILRAEFHFYHELEALGINTISTENMRLLEGERYPSLWLPRFDVEYVDGKLVRHGLESVYSLLGQAPGASLNHFTVIRKLVQLLNAQYRVTELNERFNQQEFVIEWVKRDLLNVAFGNSDNHGRNTSLIKRPDGIWFAPVYDFAPMKADPEGITRTTTWGSPYEEGGRFDWYKIASQLGDLVPPEYLIAELKAIAARLVGLRERLQMRKVPERLLSMPALQLDYLDKKLADWNLL